jgi:hypothetical protein
MPGGRAALGAEPLLPGNSVRNGGGALGAEDQLSLRSRRVPRRSGPS